MKKGPSPRMIWERGKLKPAPPAKPQTSELEERLAMQLRAARIPYERQFKAIPGRKYLFDFLVGNMWLVECEGGVWMKKGGHNTGSGIIRDIEKANLATLAGYRVLRFTHEMIIDGTALRQIEEALGSWMK